MLTDNFVQQVQLMQGRLDRLYRGADCPQPQPELLPLALKELGVASEELQVTLEELQRQNSELSATHDALKRERQRYLELFELAPHSYLVVDIYGTVREANQAAAKLLNVQQRFLIGKPLTIFLGESERPTLADKLDQLQSMEQSQEWTTYICPRDRQPVKVAIAGSHNNNHANEPAVIFLSLREIGDPNRHAVYDRLETESSPNEWSFGQDFTQKQVYLKGETIPLQQQTVWVVYRGIVKLTTICESGEEVLLGLAGVGTPFGAVDLNSFGIYEATAMTEVELACFSWSEIVTNAELAQKLLPKINQRLQQTAALLAIAGKRHVKHRLYHFLLLLSKQVGQPTLEGTRLIVRLTHSDLASACSTTRVTITRMLGKLQIEGKIAIDSKNHIIVCAEPKNGDRRPAIGY